MSRGHQLRKFRKDITLGVLALSLAVIAAWVLVPRGVKGSEASTSNALRRPTGSAQLIAINPLPQDDADGEMCPVVTASAATTLVSTLKEESAVKEESARATADDAAGPGSRIDFSKRRPIRTIHDPYSAYSSVAVDPNNNEVVVTDENLFQILVYNRTENTPKQATMSEPKRMIGGLKTNIEFQCGLYIDPSSGDIYGVNNDTVDRLVIFSRQARGDVSPDRQIKTPHGTFGITVDEDHQELMLTVQHDSAVVTYHKMAKPDEAPIRLLQGEHTLLADPHGIAYDPKHDLIFVTNHGSVHQFQKPKNGRGEGTLGQGAGKENWPLGFSDSLPGSGKNLPPSITVYSRTASGDTAPLRVITGPKTEMDWPTGLAYDPRTDEIFVANDMGDSILVFPGSASGDVTPIRVIKGPKSMVKHPTGIYLDLKNDELWSSNFGNHTATVYKPSANGDVAPLRMIRSAPLDKPTLGIGNPHPLAYDSKREQILVPNCVAHPQIAAFGRMSNNEAKPSRTIEGQKTLLGRTMHAIAYDPIHDEFTVPQELAQSVLTFRGGTNGEEPPIRVLQGPLTQIQDVARLDVDPVHNELYIPHGDKVLVFPREANGNVAPIRVIKGPDTGLGAEAVAIDTVHDLLIVAGSKRGVGPRILVFDRTADGNAKPKVVIGGKKSGFLSLGGPFAVYGPKGEIIVGIRGVGGTDENPLMASDDTYVGVWNVTDNGDVPPRYVIGGPNGILQMVRGIALDPKHKSIMVSDKRLNAVLTFSFPEIF